MNRDKVVEIAMRRVGERRKNATLFQQAVDELQLLQSSYENSGVPLPASLGGNGFWPNFLVSELSSATTTANESRLPVPQDFIIEVEDGALFRLEEDQWVGLEKTFWDRIQASRTDPGKPTIYAFMGDYFYLYPTPDAAYEMRLIYYQGAASLDTNIENRWTSHAPDLMVAGLGEILASRYMGNGGLTQEFRKERETIAARMYSSEVAREQVNFEPIKGDKHYD